MAPTGMEGFAQQAGALAGQAQGLRAAVDNGQLVMDPEAAERVAKVYEDKADELADRIMDTDRLIANGAYGKCFIGGDLEKKFSEKVNAPRVGLVPILTEMEKTLRNMAQAYRDSARDMQNADDENARSLGRNV